MPSSNKMGGRKLGALSHTGPRGTVLVAMFTGSSVWNGYEGCVGIYITRCTRSCIHFIRWYSKSNLARSRQIEILRDCTIED